MSKWLNKLLEMPADADGAVSGSGGEAGAPSDGSFGDSGASEWGSGIVGLTQSMADDIFGMPEPKAPEQSTPKPVKAEAPNPTEVASVPAVPAVPTVPEVPKPTEPSAEVTALNAQLAQMQQAMLQMQQMLLQQQAGPAKAAEASEPALPDYRVTIPANILGLLDSEEPAKRAEGLSALVQGTAVMVHQNVRNELKAVMGELLKTLPAMATERANSAVTAQSVFEDFYKTHGDLNHEALRPLVVQAARQVMSSPKWSRSGWSAEVRDEIARTVRSQLQALTNPQQVQNVVPFTQSAQPNAAPSRMGNNLRQSGEGGFADYLASIL